MRKQERRVSSAQYFYSRIMILISHTYLYVYVARAFNFFLQLHHDKRSILLSLHRSYSLAEV
jgi:hypothetical protein